MCQHTAWPISLRYHALRCSLLLTLACKCQTTAGAWSLPLHHHALHCIAVFSSELDAWLAGEGEWHVPPVSLLLRSYSLRPAH